MGQRTYNNRFNRGEIDPLALARSDVERVRDSGAFMENWLPIRLGPMSFRPGVETIVESESIVDGRLIPFVAGLNDRALIEFDVETIRVLDDATSYVTRPASTTVITNGAFTTDVSGWTDVSEVGGTAVWTSDYGGAASLSGNGRAIGALRQDVATDSNDMGVQINIVEAPVKLTISDVATSRVIFEDVLLPGTHSFLVSPAANTRFEISNSTLYRAVVRYITIESAGIMELPIANFNVATTYRYAQSLDVLFVANGLLPPQRIERRGNQSWSVVDFRADDGPFETINSDGATLTASVLQGNGTLTSSRALFDRGGLVGYVGTLFKLQSSEQNRTQSASSDNVQTLSIKVTGIGEARRFTVTTSGVFTATVTLQRSVDNIAWTDVKSYTTATTDNYLDGLDNQELFYRLNVKTGNYTSGTVTMSLAYNNGSITGIVRVTEVVSSTVAKIQVVEPLGSTDATADWYHGSWSGRYGFPNAVAIFEGRLCWAGLNKVWMSVSDTFDSYDRDIEGASASIQRTVGFGTADNIEWLYPTSRMLMGMASHIVAVRSSSFNEPITFTNANLRRANTQGSAARDVVEADNRMYFVQRSLRKIFEIDYSGEPDTYEALDLMVLAPDLVGTATIKRIAVTRQPESRVWVLLDDGTLLVYLHEPTEDVRGWSRMRLATGHLAADLVSMPGVLEDDVYLRVFNGSRSYITHLASQRDALGGNLSKHFDMQYTFTSPGGTLTGLDALAGGTARVWADGKDRGQVTVSGMGTVTLDSAAYTNVTIGKPYTAKYLSNKLSDYVDGMVFNQNKRVTHLGAIMKNVVPQFFQYGSDESHLQPMPNLEDGTSYDKTVRRDYDELPFEFDGTYDSDSRYYLQTTAPCTVLAVTVVVDDPNYPPA
jgi:hypothetical protein